LQLLGMRNSQVIVIWKWSPHVHTNPSSSPLFSINQITNWAIDRNNLRLVDISLKCHSIWIPLGVTLKRLPLYHEDANLCLHIKNETTETWEGWTQSQSTRGQAEGSGLKGRHAAVSGRAWLEFGSSPPPDLCPQPLQPPSKSGYSFSRKKGETKLSPSQPADRPRGAVWWAAFERFL